MNKRVLLLSAATFILFSCKGNNIDLPKSPFDDSYVRIGMVGEYETDGNTLSIEEYQDLKNSIDNDEIDYKVSSYTRNLETRDLKYAYFGRESSAISQCSLLSRSETANRYSNNVLIDESVDNRKLQSDNSGIIKTSLALTDYVFDDGYNTSLRETYSQRRKRQNNGDPIEVTSEKENVPYEPAKSDSIFGLTPLTSIKNEFKIDKIRGVPFTFSLLADNNNAVYGKIKDSDKYLIKEGYSLFADYITTIGRKYKAVDNFFYEGVLEKNTFDSKNIYRFIQFRLYHEVLILSESYDGEGVPVLYLEKPMLIEFSEVKYHINYDSLSPYAGTIPDITQ